MWLINSFVHNPIKVSVGVLLVALFGVVALTRMPMQLTPEVQTPTITIETRWGGASPQEVEREIIIEQEEQLKGVEGVRKMSSESMDSVGRIILEFQVGSDMEKAVVDVIGRLEQVREYPVDADRPVISTSNANDSPIAWFILSGRQPSPDEIRAFEERYPQLVEKLGPVRQAHSVGLALLRLRSLAEQDPEFKELLPPEDLDVTKLRRFAENEIEARFERVSGVSQSNVIGGLEDELQVVINPQELAARRLTIGDVRRVLTGQNADTSAGDYWEGKRRWVTRTLGQFRDEQQVADQLLAVRDGAPVYVGDVAEVRIGYKKPDGVVRRFGEGSIAVNALRETGANVLDVMTGLRQVTRELNDDVLRKMNLQLTQVYDETEYIYSSINLVQQNIFIGGALTMVVLMMFLHLGVRALIAVPMIILTALAAAYVSPWFFLFCLAIIVGAGFWFARGSLVVGLAIPTSLIGSFLVLGLLGRSLNVVSLAGLAFAVGMLVDNAVVVLENIYRRHSLGEPPFVAAVKGTQEVWGAVASSTLTTVAVFLPIVFIQEEAGQLFRDIALAISAAVSLSLIVSMSVIPAASARLFTHRGSGDEEMPESETHSIAASSQLTRAAAATVRPITVAARGFTNLVVQTNDWIQRSLPRRIAVVAVLVIGSVMLGYAFWPKVEYLPNGNRNLVFGIVLPPPGYNLNELMQLGETVEERLRPYWDVDPESEEAKKLNAPIIEDFFFVARGRQVFMGVRAHDPLRARELVPVISQAAMALPGTFAVAKQSSLFEQGLSAGRTIEIEITGPDLIRIAKEVGPPIMGAVQQAMPAGTQARPVPSLDTSTPETHIRPKLLQMAQMGLSSAELGYAVNALIDGAYAGDYFYRGDEIDVTIMGMEQYAKSYQDVKALPVATPTGQLVPLEALADVELTGGPEQINHRERERAITIEVSPPADMALEDAMDRIRNEIVQPMIANGLLRDGERISLAGTADKLRDTWQALRFNVLLALLITYLLMAALFESWLYPFVIILTVPLGAVGGILGLNLLNVFLAATGQTLQQLDVLTMLGFVILIGTVVNNPILIVHQSLNHMREDGMGHRAAILESVRTRIRPIFMTTITTVLGLLPLVLFPGAGSELYRGLGSVVLGGLLVSTVFTLLLVPTLFSLMMDAKELLIGILHRIGRKPTTLPKQPKEQKAPAIV